MFNTEELQIIADLLDRTPIQGTLHTLPAALSKLAQIRVKIQNMLDAEKTAKEVVKPKSIESRTM